MIDIRNATDQARGAILGAFIGDASGATLEFLGRKPARKEVQSAMKMTGGGVWRTAPGQITDDGELTLALCHALNDGDKYNPLDVARSYRGWYLSNPFDIGSATSNALGAGELDDVDLAEKIRYNAATCNIGSKANGSLMRATPLGVWSARVSMEEAINAARLDSRLTHPNQSCQWAVAAYVLAIRHLVLHPGDHVGAVLCARDSLSCTEASEVLGWLQDALTGALPAFFPMAGFVRIAFTHAMHHLSIATNFFEGIDQVLAGGGDTDTNACIVGGLLGALHGESGLPVEMRKAVIECDVTTGRPRPEWLRTRNFFGTSCADAKFVL